MFTVKIFMLLLLTTFTLYASPISCAKYAAQNDDFLLMDACIKHGYLTNSRINQKGEHLLHLSHTFSLEMFIYLIDKGANIYAKTDKGSTIFEKIPLDSEQFLYLLDHFSLFETLDDTTHAKIVHTIFKDNNLTLQNRLIEKHANLSAKDKVGWTPLMYAIYNANLPIISLLLNHGATVNPHVPLFINASIEAFFHPKNQALITHLIKHDIPIKQPKPCSICIKSSTTKSEANYFLNKKSIRMIQNLLYLRADLTQQGTKIA
jgi:hypothetical protein